MKKPKNNTPRMEKLHFQVVGLTHDELNQDLYISLDFPIYCPKCKLKGTDIILDGRENKVKGRPQKFECKTCGKNFCTHTSYFFIEAMQALFTLAFNEVVQTRNSVKEVAHRFQLAPSTLHEFIARVRGELVTKTNLIQTILTHENAQTMTLLGINKAIFIDETFLKIKGSTYYLIVAVNVAGVPLVWKLSSSRKQDVIQAVINELTQQYGIPRMIVTDGNPSYKHVLTHLRYEGYHVIHFHKDCRNRINIRKCSFEANSHHYTEDIVGLNNDVFVTPGTKPVWWLTLQKKISVKKGKRGRPKGSRNRIKNANDLKSRQNSEPLEDSRNKPKNKRGPKNVFREGRLVEIRVEPSQQFLEVLPGSPSLNLDATDSGGQLDTFRLFNLLYPVLIEFSGRYITSNRIENMFSQFDSYFIPKGRRSQTTVWQEITSWFVSRVSFSYLTPLIHHIARSFSPRMAIRNLNKLLIPTKLTLS